MAWIENGPVSLPPRPVAYLAGGVLVICALAGVGLGFQGSWRNGGRPSLGAGQALGPDQSIIARPIVDIPPVQAPAANTVAAAAANSANSEADNDDDNTNDIASQTAAVQAVQSRPSKSADIDDLLTSRSEKPQAPAKPSTDEGAPSDVPF